jgi:PAS domain S-box-containing protein
MGQRKRVVNAAHSAPERPELSFMDDVDMSDVQATSAASATSATSKRAAAARSRRGGVRTWFTVTVLLAAVPSFALVVFYWLVVDDASVTRLVIGTALVGIVAIYAARHIAVTRILAPIERLSRQAERLRAGDLTARTAAPYLAGELGRLEVSFDAMAAALEWNDRKLEAAERRYRAIVESIPAALYVVQVDAVGNTGATVYMSPQIRSFLSYEPLEFVADLTLWSRTVHVDDRPRLRTEIAGSVESGKPFALDHRSVARDGTVRWMRNTGAIVRDEGGRPAYVRGFMVDITERKTLEEQFHRAQKLEAVGQLAAGVAHDFNNVMTVIGGYCEMLLVQMPAGDPRRAAVATMTEASTRASSLTHQLLAFSRKQTLQPTILDLNTVVRESVDVLARLLGPEVELVTQLAPDLGLVRVDAAQFDQVLFNLVGNARDAMPRGGRLTISTRDSEVDAAYAERHPGVRAGRYSMMSVTDTGCGMGASTLAHLFEPFFTTKPRGEGTGLGLAAVYGIVEQSGGHLAVDTQVGHGTTFRIYLPRVESEPAYKTATDDEAASEAPRGSETILVAEDEPTVLCLVRDVLLSAGYRVLEGASPSQVLTIAQAHEGPIALVLADVVLPEMSGPDLAGRLREMLPDVRVLYMSGHTYEALGHRRLLSEGTELLKKPFTPSELRRRVRETLDRPRDAVGAARPKAVAGV